MSDDELEKKFNLIPITGTVLPVEKKPDPIAQLQVDINRDNAVKDFSTARTNLQTILDIGATAISELGDLATRSQSAENFAALAQMIKSVSDVSTKMLHLHKQLEELNSKEADRSNPKEEHYHNHLHVASTKEMGDFLKGKKE